MMVRISFSYGFVLNSIPIYSGACVQRRCKGGGDASGPKNCKWVVSTTRAYAIMLVRIVILGMMKIFVEGFTINRCKLL